MNYFFTVFKLKDILSLKIFLIQFLHKWACEYRKTCCILLTYSLFYSSFFPLLHSLHFHLPFLFL